MSQFALLRSRRFLPLFVTQFLGAFNDNVFRFALIIFVTFTLAERTGIDARMLVVLTGGVFILPFLLFSALAGQLADKYEKAQLIRWIKTAEIIIMGLGAVGFWLADYYFLLTVLFLMGTHSTFFGPLKYAVLPQHLAEAEMTGGNGLIQMATYIAILSGGIAGGMLAGLERSGPIAVVAAVVGIAVCGRLTAAYIPLAQANMPTMNIDLNPLRSTWRLMADAARERDLWIIILLISMFWFVGATYLSVVPSYGKELLHANAQAVTLLSAAFTVGIGIGSLLCERLSRKRIELGLVPWAAVGISLASFDVFVAGTPSPPLAELSPGTFFTHGPALRFFVDLVLIGGFGALFIVPLYAALQARAAAEVRSRRLAALNIANALLMVLSAGMTMLLFALGVSMPGVFLIIGTLNLLAIIVAVRCLPELVQRARSLIGAR